MKSPAADVVSVKKRHGGSGGFALGCGCKDAKSVSVVVSASPSPSSATSSKTTRRGSGAGTTTTTDTLTSASSSSLWEDAVAELRYKNGDCGRLQQESSSSFSGLLRELSELEKSVASWGARKVVHRDDEEKPRTPPQEHRNAKTDDDDVKVADDEENRRFITFGAAARDGDDAAGAGLECSVAVVKQSDDPLGDFRRSMLRLIVENGVLSGEGLREMLRRFLALNAPHHHDVILRAFAEIWDDVFVVAASLDDGCATTPGRARASRCAPGRRPPAPRTPPRHRGRSTPAWRV